jgi:predicted transcriptional regulator YdeE/DNA-binding transcriptional MerR regulator
MIKIGDFSKLAHVSIKTLHHYDEIGLIKPAHVDRYTGYRYYVLEQLSSINRILALKDLGLSLEQIAQLLDENLSTAEMRGMLRMKQIELANKLQEEQSRLARVEIRLRQLEQEGSPPAIDIAIKEIPAQTVLTARAVAANDEALIPARQSLKQLLQEHLTRARISPIGPWFTVIDDLPYDESNLEVELAIEINPKAGLRSGDWGISPVQLKAFEAVPNMASIIYSGDYASIIRAYTNLYAWTQRHGYTIAGSCREIYLPDSGFNTMPEPFETAFTEVQCPVRASDIPLSIQSPYERKEKIMEPKIISKPAFKAVGLSYVGKNQADEIPKLWDNFNPRYNEINASDNSCCYGLCFSTPIDVANLETLEPGVFEYVAALEVANDKEVPDGMVYREIPAYKYVVFTHHGKLDKLGETYKYIYETWLPQSEYKNHPDKFDMEVYTDEFMLGSDDSKFYIYVAIE